MALHPNGEWPASELAVIPGGTKMGGSALIKRDLLPSVVAMQEACLRETGLELRPTSAGDGYRSKPRQHDTFMGRYVLASSGEGPFYDVRWYDHNGNGIRSRFVRVSSAGSAAVPGTSNHGDAEAIDWADMWGERLRWMRANAHRFGWHNPLWARDDNPRNGSYEPWHWEPLAAAYAVNNWASMQGHPALTTPTGTLPGGLTPKDWFDMATEEELRRIVAEEVARLLPIALADERPNLTKPMLDQANKAVAPVLDAIRALPDAADKILRYRVPGIVEGSASELPILVRDARVAATTARDLAIEIRDSLRPAPAPATAVEDDDKVGTDG